MHMCIFCGNVVEEVTYTRWKHTEIDGDYYECDEDPCGCGGYFVDAAECKRCGEYEAENELTNGWCRACVTELCEAKGLDTKADRSEIYDIIEEGEYD